MLSAATTRQWSHVGRAAPSRRRRSRPARRSAGPCGTASAKAARRLRELPLVEMPEGDVGSARPWAMTWRAKTRSKPTSLPSAVSTAWSSTRQRAGTAPPTGGRLNSSARPAASVELPPLPKVSSRPPAAKRSAIIAAAVERSSSAASPAASTSRTPGARPRPWPRADAARSSSSAGGVVAVVAEERVQEVGALSHRPAPRRSMAVPAWTSTRSPAATVADEGGVDRLDAPRGAHRHQAVGRAPSATSAGRPSSRQVTQVAVVAVVVAGAGAASSPGCSKQTWVSSHSTW